MSVTSNQVRSFASYQVNRLLSLPDGAQKAALANLRRGLGHAPGELPELWGEFLLTMPEEMLSRTGEPTRAEWAVYTALTMFALHQQGRDPRTESVNRSGQTLGLAARQLVHDEKEDRPRVARRFNAFATAADAAELAHHLRGLVQLFKAEGIALDYPLLASDLFRYLTPSQTDQVRLSWGQDFYSSRKNVENNANEREENSHEQPVVS